MQTAFTQLMGIDVPIVQGAMAWVSDAELAAAVSRAGGLGIIASAGRTPEWTREEIRKARTLTDRPFGVNIVLQDADWPEKLQVILEEKPACVTAGAGNPVPLIEPLHEAGIKIFPVVPSVRLAKRVESAGADALVIEGLEAGGHIGNSTTMALLSQVIPAVSIPVIAAGGIADGRAMAAALAMGAAGVQMGTRFYASEECTAHPKAKEAIVLASDTDSVTTGRGAHLVRGLRNAMSEKYAELLESGAPKEELTKLVRGSSYRAPQEGDVEWGMVQAGQSLTLITEVLPVQTIIGHMLRDAQAASNLLHHYFLDRKETP